MSKINSFKIQGFYENKNTYLEFKTNQENFLLKLSKNYEYLANLFKKWDVQYSSSLSRNNRNTPNKKHPHELYRFQLITIDILKLLTDESGPLNQIIETINKFDKYILDNNIAESKLYKNIIDEKPTISSTKIIQEILKISELILPKFDKTDTTILSKNLSAFVMSSQQNFTLSSEQEKDLKNNIWDKADNRLIQQNVPKIDLEKFQTILEKKENESKLLFSLNTEEGQKKAKTIKKELSDLYNSIQNITGIYDFFKAALDDTNLNDKIFTVPYPEIHQNGKNVKDIRTFGKKGENEVAQYFWQFDKIYLKSKLDLIEITYKEEPIFFETFSEVVISDASDCTLFYLPNNEIDLNNIQLYIDLVKNDLKYRKKSELMSRYLSIEKQFNYSDKTEEFKTNKQYGIIDQRKDDTDAENKTSSVFRTLLDIRKNLDQNYNSLSLLTLNELLEITNNYINIFKKEGLIKNYIKFIKENEKKNKENEKESKKEDQFKSNLEDFVKLLNKLNLRNLTWPAASDTPLNFTSPYFSYKEYVLIDSDSALYTFQVNLNLQEIVLNNYLRYLINFISNDQEINNTKNYEYDIKENIPESTENNILLPPFLNVNKDKKDCCFILISKGDIKKFNDKNPNITNKSIFTNPQNLDSLLAEIFKYNSGERDSRFKDEMAFKKNINLLNEIYFSPHPLQNPLIKHFQKNNIIKVKGKEYTILNLKIDNIPDINKYSHKESQKDGKKVSERTYTINLTLTVLPPDVSHNIITEIQATCPDKKKKLEDKHKEYIKKIPGLSDIYKQKFVPTTWKIQDGKLKKKGFLEGGKTQKIYKYYNKRNKTQHQKYKNKKKDKFTYKLHKFKKTFKKIKNL